MALVGDYYIILFFKVFTRITTKRINFQYKTLSAYNDRWHKRVVFLPFGQGTLKIEGVCVHNNRLIG